jgi:phospholipase/carboxylesterase
VPAGHVVERPIPLAVVLHGAGGNPRRTLSDMLPFVDTLGLALLVPGSLGPTWDAWGRGRDAEIAALDGALAAAFEAVAVDPLRVGIMGLSDGASCALAVGLANGDLFGRIVAYSPGFVDPLDAIGRPEIFLSQGARDPFFPPDRCGRRIAAELGAGGHEVTYREFEGGHEVPPEVRDEAQAWLCRPAAEPGSPPPSGGSD